MFIYYRTIGLIVKKTDLNEADQLLTIYTKDFGKLEILAKAIRKINSKLRSGVDLFYLSEIEFIQGRVYKTLTDALLIEKYEDLKDLGKFKIALALSDLLDTFLRGEEPDEKIWHLLTEIFQKLNTSNLKPLTYNLIYYYFFWNFFSFLGYQIDFYNCSFCQKKLQPEKLYFEPKEGGIICSRCSKKLKGGKEIIPGTIKIIRILLKRDWLTLEKLRIKKEDLKSLKETSEQFKQSTGNF